MEMIDLHATHRSPLVWAARPLRRTAAALQSRWLGAGPCFAKYFLKSHALIEHVTMYILTSVRLHHDPPSACHTRHRTHTGAVGESAYGALVDTQHEDSLNDVGEGLHLLITEH
jgi:hypothetical protein